jgi:hypothetical protein
VTWPAAPDLAGRWRIRRVILGQGRLEGIGEAVALGDGRFAWREEGDLRLASGTRLRAHRRYAYRIDAAARVIECFYDDGPQAGQLLHRFAFGQRQRLARHRHECAPDLYLAKLRLAGPDCFQLSYRVRGPRKDYAMSTICLRWPPAPQNS